MFLVHSVLIFISPLVSICLNPWRSLTNPGYWWSSVLNTYFQTRYTVSSGKLYRKPCVYLANHRSVADFWIDGYLTEGRAVFIARWTVAIIFWTILPFCTGYVLLFRRGSTRRQALYDAIDRRLMCTGYNSVLAYPEGTRRTEASPGPLRTGFILYAYNRGLPVQCVVAHGKERVYSLKHLRSSTGVMIRVAYADPLCPTTFEDYHAFHAAVEAAWHRAWGPVDGTILVPEEEEPLFALSSCSDMRTWCGTLLAIGCVAYIGG
jgi:1-acyl-sn-glycerol-3-phosphate acyltransferase